MNHLINSINEKYHSLKKLNLNLIYQIYFLNITLHLSKLHPIIMKHQPIIKSFKHLTGAINYQSVDHLI